MKTEILVCLFVILELGVGKAQNPIVEGRVLEYLSINPIQDVRVHIENTRIEVKSDQRGYFSFDGMALPRGEQSLLVEKSGYRTKRLSIQLIEDGKINLDPLFLQNDWQGLEAEIGVISLSDDELTSDDFEVNSLPGALHASKGVFAQAAAFDFSSAFFRRRGLDSRYSKLFINGAEMNSMENGRPLWKLMGGLNDVQRNRDGIMGLKPHKNGFGDLGNNTHFTMRASQYRKGGSVSYARANRSYQNRIMATYHSGVAPSGWSYSLLASLREGDQGYVEGTSYDAKSVFAAIEKVWNSGNSLNITAFYAPIERGRSTPLTDEVLRLKGNRYNPNWGMQNGRERISRIGKVVQPVICLSYYSKLSDGIHWENHLSLIFGEESTSRIENAGVRNPYPHYYQRLPSYFLKDETPTVYDYQMAYWAAEEFKNNGQLSWDELYQTNSMVQNSIAKYALMKDVSKNRQINLSSLFRNNTSGFLKWHAKIDYTRYRSEKYAQMVDILGAASYLDIDSFYDGNEEGFDQSDVNNPNRLINEGDRYKYHYAIFANRFRGSAQWIWTFGKTEVFLGLKSSYSKYQREGFYRNGYFQEANRSFGMSEAPAFFNYGLKVGLSYQWNAKHFTESQIWYGNSPPMLQSSFANSRQNNDLVDALESEKSFGGVLNQRFRTSSLDIDITTYYIALSDITKIGFFFTQNAIGLENNSAFVQEIVQGISRQQLGVEIGMKWQIQSSVNLKAAAAIGQNIYSNTPSIYLSGDDFDYELNDGIVEGNDLISRGKRKVFLNNYHVAAGPERVYKVGFEYRDPNYWWAGLTANYFSNSFIDISSLRRSEDFMTDEDGLPYANYEPIQVRQLLRQEKLTSFFIMNLVGGKSWRLKKYYLGIFASISNLLNEDYRTGGFEDSRYSSYPQQLQEQNRTGGPLFGNRYFSGRGTSYFISLSLRF